MLQVTPCQRELLFTSQISQNVEVVLNAFDILLRNMSRKRGWRLKTIYQVKAFNIVKSDSLNCGGKKRKNTTCTHIQKCYFNNILSIMFTCSQSILCPVFASFSITVKWWCVRCNPIRKWDANHSIPLQHILGTLCSVFWSGPSLCRLKSKKYWGDFLCS